jgi:hypothetical protein
LNNSNGSVSQVINQSWNSISASWENSKKTNYSYNVTDDVVLSVTQLWDGFIWLNDYKITYNYDASNFLVYALNQDWSNSIWINDAQDIFTYNGNGTLHQIESQEWDIASSIWNNNIRLTFSYAPLNVANFEQENRVVVYPNPAEYNVNVKINKIHLGSNYAVYDVSGRVFLIGVLDNEQSEIAFSALGSGVYYLEIKGANRRVIPIIKN